MRLAILPLLLTACTAAPAPPRHDPPRRIVSLNLCADQQLLALADDDQIAGLTRLSRDPAMSAGAKRAAHLPVIDATAEDLLQIRPDLVLSDAGFPAPALAALPDTQFRTVPLNWVSRYDDIVAQLRQVGDAVGHRDRADRLVARMDAALARIDKAAGRGQVAADYQRRGFLTGSGTLVDELMGRVGLVNLATRLGKPALSQLSLEEMVAAHPDLLLRSESPKVIDRGTELLAHPAIADLARVDLPQAWTVCGGPAYVLAAERLADAVRSAASHRQKPARMPA
ncbi:ABC transporter substrate-binding protein [Sphingomonas sp. Leaf4]|uniref:ABC transporter substrate-binding protein n=1 Tax=Sphingomonas sp. Leaf4 TaxID=2876553 RepID=UPI001E5B0EC3|nr:ABC transporter substrate-binding protein [Sphingomonas sp. Leaf4]